MIFPHSEHWIPWYQRWLFRCLDVFGANRRCVRRFLGGHWELRMVDFPVCSDLWLPVVGPDDPHWGLVRGNALDVEQWGN